MIATIRIAVIASVFFLAAAFSRQLNLKSFGAAVLAKRATSSHELKMAVWGVQKLGQSVVGTTSISSPSSGQSSIFKRPTTGSGTDDRIPFSREQEEEDNKMLSRMDKALQQRDLLMALESRMIGTPEKLQRIRMAATVENVLPSSFCSEVTSTPSLHAGGLMDDWEM